MPSFAELIRKLGRAAPLGAGGGRARARLPGDVPGRLPRARSAAAGSRRACCSWRPTSSTLAAPLQRDAPAPPAGRRPSRRSRGSGRSARRSRPIRKMADVILDTSRFTVHQLRDYVRERYDVRAEARRMLVSVLSFGYKYGVPAEADLVFDVRFLPNPNFVPRLRRLTRRRPRGGGLSAATAGDGALPAAGPGPRCASCCRATSAREGATSRSRSAAPAAGTAR